MDAGPTAQQPAEPWSELVVQAVAREELALDRLLMAVTPRLLARIERRLPFDVRTLCSPDDVLQDTFSEAFRGFADFRVPPNADPAGAFIRWITTVADHRVVDAVRSLRAAKRGGGRLTHSGAGSGTDGQTSMIPLLEALAGDQPTPSKVATGQELESALRQAIASLYPSYREALELRYLLGLSPSEVAARLNRTEEAVHKLCSRAVQALREAVGDLGQYISRTEPPT